MALAAEHPLRFVLTVDSHGLFSTVATLHEGSDYRLLPTVARMRDSLETVEIKFMHWIAEKRNFADALMKRSLGMFKELNDVMRCGFLDSETFKSSQRVSYVYCSLLVINHDHFRSGFLVGKLVLITLLLIPTLQLDVIRDALVWLLLFARTNFLSYFFRAEEPHLRDAQ